MTRLTAARAAPPLEDVEFFLEFGPLNHGPPEFTDEQAEVAWSAYGPQIMSEWPRDKPGFRPWAFWEFEVREKPDYEDYVIRLAELGLLFEEEIASLAKKRRWRDINTGVEHVDDEATEFYERVLDALEVDARST